jgi:general secretion pathway protein A
MYKQFFGLEKNPFNMTPDPTLLYLTAQHREALAGLTYAVMRRKGLAVLTGDVGTGKTTLLRRVLRNLPASKIQSAVILNPTLTPNEFFELMLLDFGITDVPPSKAQRLLLLERLLLEGHAGGRISILAVDEAHKLTPVVLEEIRLLSNFESGEDKLLQIVLIGQNELDGVLDEDHLRQLKQRISVRLAISALNSSEIEGYITYRWTQCGGAAPTPFPAEAVAAIAAWSHGAPRLINSICDSALTLAFGNGARSISAACVAEVARDLRLRNGVPAAMIPNPVAADKAPPVAAGPPAQSISTIRIFEDYGLHADQSLLSRCAAKLGLAGWFETQ